MGASKQNIRAGGAYIEIAEKGVTAVQRKLDNLGKSLNAMGDKMKNAGTKMMAWSGAAMGGMFAAAKSFASTGAALDDMAQRTGASGEALSLLSYAAEMSGTSLDTLETVLKKTNKAVGEALSNPTGEQADLLKSMGLDPATLSAMKPEERLLALSDAMAGMNDNARELAAIKLFKSTEALPFLTQGADAIRKQMQEGKVKGFGMTDAEIKLAAQLDDAFVDMWLSIRKVALEIGAALAPAIMEFINWLVPTAKMVAEWIANNQGLIVSVAKLAIVIFGAGAALYAIGTVFTIIGGAIGGVSSVIGFLFGIVQGAIGLFGFLSSAIAAIPAVIGVIGSVIGFLISPIGLVIAGITLLVGWIAKTAIGIGSASLKVRSFGDVFKEIKGIFSDAWGGIVAAVMSGDLSTALEIVWTALKMVWMKGAHYLYEKWIAFKFGVFTIFSEMYTGIVSTLSLLWSYILKGVANVTWFFKWAWREAIDFVKGIWRDLVNGIASLYIKAQGFLGIISPEEEKQQLDILNDMAEMEEKKAKEAHDAEVKRIDDEADAALAKINEEEAARQAAIEADRQAEEDARKKQSDAEIDALKKEEAAAKKKLDHLISKAKEGAREVNKIKKEGESKDGKGPIEKGQERAGDKGGPPPPPPPPPSEITSTKISSAGTFSAWGARGLGGNIEGHLITQIGLLRSIVRNTKKGAQFVPMFIGNGGMGD
jgi:hypothetical protein